MTGLLGTRPFVVGLALSFLVGLTVISGGGVLGALVRWLIGSEGFG